MGFAPWLTCLWPGLPRLWWRGQGTGFLTAAFFAAWLNAVLAVTFVIPHLTPSSWRMVGWLFLGVFWVYCLHRGVRRLSQIYAGDGRLNDALFCRAQEEYLQGHWFEAESLLLQLVREEPADVEGRLLLATLYRHTRRPDAAQAQLGRVERHPHAARWAWEIHQERKHLERDGDPTTEIVAGAATEESAADQSNEPSTQNAVLDDGSIDAVGLSKAA